ncbi:MAG: dihydroorotate dehydrogenase [Pseudomonadota bacterium]
MSDISVKLFGQKLNTPIIMASGTFGYGNEYDFIDINSIGAICTKGLSLAPREGNPTPRIVETEYGMINSVGLQNVGVKAFIKEKLPEIRNLNTKIIANFFGNTEEEYLEVAKILDGVKEIFALEMNVSCPNIKSGGLSFGQCPKQINKLTSGVKKLTTKPLIVKLTPNVTEIKDIAKAAEDGGADAVSMINTIKAMKIDIKTGKPILGNIMGGLSGKAVKPVAIRCVYETAKTIKIPIIGLGGIYDAEDVIEFFMAGASAVQVGSAIFQDPDVCKRICGDLRTYMDKNKIKDMNEIKGRAL